MYLLIYYVDNILVQIKFGCHITTKNTGGLIHKIVYFHVS